MKITWLGHACFLLEQDGFRVVTDPYTRVPGYPDPRVEAHAVYCSHTHPDHNAVQCVTLLPPPAENPFTVREVHTFHDNQSGAQRGNNTIRVFTAGGVSVAHMGDLGHQLSREQLAELGRPDAMLIPVGGFYTIDAKDARSVCFAVGPRCVVPMHYRHPPYGLEAVGGVEEFLRLWKPEEVHRLDGPSFELTEDTAGVYVPKYV